MGWKCSRGNRKRYWAAGRNTKMGDVEVRSAQSFPRHRRCSWEGGRGRSEIQVTTSDQSCIGENGIF